MKHSIWYLIPFLLVALYFADTVYEKSLALQPQANLKAGAKAETPANKALNLPATEANLLTK